ncbi:hypothetical protein D1BOALGB6SA_10353 [Olavius sp. associated proteobacterium Delta 1]|nr:hypothetical protein D1BOALGB6SA_10353 [Olavius sp. associated proteobacterium Delta 1]
MQVTCSAFDWEEVRKRPNAETVVEEMILTDDIDLYDKPLPDGIWLSDSATQHFDTAEVLEEALKTYQGQYRDAFSDVASLISCGASIDELGISPLTDDCYFVSLSPEKVKELIASMQAIDLDAVPGITPDAKEWVTQWQKALEYAMEHGWGIIGHCG